MAAAMVAAVMATAITTATTTEAIAGTTEARAREPNW
jgi:hypothetical protein